MGNSRTPKALQPTSRVLPSEESQLQEVQVANTVPAAVIASMNTDLGVMPIVAATKEFKTGSRGYYGVGKLTIGGRRYQVSLQLVEIGSKGK